MLFIFFYVSLIFSNLNRSMNYFSLSYIIHFSPWILKPIIALSCMFMNLKSEVWFPLDNEDSPKKEIYIECK